MSFFQALLAFDFLRNALYASLLVATVCGVLGTYTVIHRSSYMVGAVSHSLLGGIGMARYCQCVLGLAALTPLLGSVLVALLVALLLTFCSLNPRYREDALLTAIWTVGIAAGLCFIRMIPGYSEDLNAYLFGNILLISNQDLAIMLVLDILVLLLACLYHHRFTALFFNKELLRLKSISLPYTILLLNVLTAISVVLLSQAVGVVLALALMILPASTSLLLCKRLWSVMLLSGILCFLECLCGIYFSYTLTNCSAGATTILIAGLLYLICFIFRKLLPPAPHPQIG